MNAVIGKKSYSFDLLYANYRAMILALNQKKPDSMKKNFIIRGNISSNSGPSFKVSPDYINRMSKRFEFR